MTEQMTAIVQNVYGTSQTWHLEKIDRPAIKPDEVLIRVKAAGLDRGTWHLMAGLPYVVRLGFGFKGPKNPVPGLDVAGTVVAVGDEVTKFQPGDEAFGIAKGSFAEYAAAKEKKLAPKPSAASFAQAAALPVSGLTALQAVRNVGKVSPGQAVLVIGASGGVGTYVVQLAKHAGADVTGVCSGAKADLVTSLGADHIVDYKQDDFTTTEKKYDVIFDIAGNTKLAKLRSVLAPAGTLVIIGGEDGGKLVGGIHRQLGAMFASPLSKQKLKGMIAKEKGEDIEMLAELFQEGQLAPTIEKEYPLADSAEAMHHMETGKVRGKVVISV